MTPATDLIHVAGVLDHAEARMLVRAGFKQLGFPLRLGYHQEDLETEAAATIVQDLGEQAEFFLITYLDGADAIIDLCRQLRVNKVQLHDEVSMQELKRLRSAWPDLYVIKSLIVGSTQGEPLSDQVARLSAWVDAFITDTFDPETGATGATGKTHDWSVSAALVRQSPRPVILAGGLNPGNVRHAIDCVRPAGVDVHTGLEGPDGRKQSALAEEFILEASAGFRSVRL